jgi:hypothetical protein
MSADLVVQDVLEGKVLDGPGFTNLYRLLDLERNAIEEVQHLTMPAAFEILAAYEDGRWREDMRAEHDGEIERTGLQPRWSPDSFRSFAKWVRAQAERDGHELRTWQMLSNLKNAAECVRIGRSDRATTAVVASIDAERIWRPAAKLLNMGDVGRKQIPAMITRAAELAEEQGYSKIESGHMLAARTEILKSAPELQRAVHPDQASAHDKALKARRQAEGALNDLVRTQDWDAVDAFHEWYLEWRRNVQVARKEAR